ncbi:MAG: sodium:proton antiporter NhaD [Bacteroidota bacterium]
MLFSLTIIFLVGYALIAFEHSVKVNKAATAILTGVLCWMVYILNSAETNSVVSQLMEHLADISQILFFLLSAMTIVELIDSHDGFDIITKRITTTKKTKLLALVCFITFFLSAIIDNLTTTIVMISLIQKLIPEKKTRLLFAGMIIIAANAGGAWSPIGDVTTTMLWIGGQITAGNVIFKLFLPSLVCLIVPLTIVSAMMTGKISRRISQETNLKNLTDNFEKKLVFFTGFGVLIAVPVFKTVTQLPPFMGILFGLGIMWVVTELIHKKKEENIKTHLSVYSALTKIDTTSILFFLGILLCVSALQSTGILAISADFLSNTVKNESAIAITFGLLSSIIDNVPLVAATMGMYDLNLYPTDHYFWEFIAYCAGTGGSILIIGSAAGVVAMGMEKINFIWYLKNFSMIALFGYLAGALVYVVQNIIFV